MYKIDPSQLNLFASLDTSPGKSCIFLGDFPSEKYQISMKFARIPGNPMHLFRPGLELHQNRIKTVSIRKKMRFCTSVTRMYSR